MNMKKLLTVLALGTAFTSGNVLAGGNDGHRAVGAIADQLLKGSAAQAQVARLLLPSESLEKIANWPDCVKGTYCGPQSPEMLTYVAANPKHGEDHYTNVPFQNAHYHDHGVARLTTISCKRSNRRSWCCRARLMPPAIRTASASAKP